MFQVAFGDPDKSDSYGRKKKEEGSSATDSVTDVTDVTDVRKKEEGRSNRPHRESAIKNILTLRAVAILIKSFALKK
jgi:hypothetical protein